MPIIPSPGATCAPLSVSASTVAVTDPVVIGTIHTGIEWWAPPHWVDTVPIVHDVTATKRGNDNPDAE